MGAADPAFRGKEPGLPQAGIVYPAMYRGKLGETAIIFYYF